jgi:HK97 family phage prohead protease
MDFNIKEIKYANAFIVDEKEAIDEVNHRINFVVSSEIVDRDGEVVEAQAVYDGTQRKNEFSANPVCLISHQHKLSDGTVPSIGPWMTDTAKLKSKRVEMVLQFDIELELGKQYWIAYKNKTMRAVSIGFATKDYRVEEINGKRVYIITKLELLEISVCAVGANQQAMSKMKGMEYLADEKGIAGNVAKYFEAMEKRITSLIEERFDQVKDLLVKDPDGCGADELGDSQLPPVAAKKTGKIFNALNNLLER